MHEAALMRDVMARIEQVVREAGGARARRVEVWLGALSHFTPEHFREHFCDAASGGPAEGATVVCVQSDDITHADAGGVRVLRLEVDDGDD